MSIAHTAPQVRSMRQTSCWCWQSHEIFDRFGAQLGWNGMGLYSALARHANNATGQCWPSLAYLAQKAQAVAATPEPVYACEHEHVDSEG